MQEIPNILELLTVSASDLGFKGFADGKQFKHMITDGSFAIKRDALRGQKNLPKYLLDALNAPISDQTGDKTIDELVAYTQARMVAIEPLENKISGYKGMNKKVIPLMAFGQCGINTPNKPIKVNAKLLKMIWSIFPACDWYLSPNKTLCLCDGSEIIALLAPIQTK